MKKKHKTGGPHKPLEEASRILEAAIPELAEEAVKLAKKGKPTLLRVLRRILADAEINHSGEKATDALHRNALRWLRGIPRPTRRK